MDLRLKNKIVLITASAHGLGKGIARSFLEEGSKVVITGLSKERAEKTSSEFRSEFGDDRIFSFSGDLTNDEVIKQCVQEVLNSWGRIDILIANLGSGRGTSEWRVSESEWIKTMDINLNGARKMTNEVVPHMLQNGRGSIIFISSIAGVQVIGAPISYSVAKAALIAYSKNLSKKLARENIRVNVICPGNIYFEDGTWHSKLKKKQKQVLNMLDKNVPMNRFATSDEIANVVLFLASEKASFLTGACIIADGGQTNGI